MGSHLHTIKTLLLSLFLISTAQTAFSSEKSLFNANCLTVQTFLTEYAEFRPDSQDIKSDELLQLLETKYLRSNVNLYLPKGKESDVFFDVYNDLIQEGNSSNNGSEPNISLISHSADIWGGWALRQESKPIIKIDSIIRVDGSQEDENSDVFSKELDHAKTINNQSQRLDTDEDFFVKSNTQIENPAALLSHKTFVTPAISKNQEMIDLNGLKPSLTITKNQFTNSSKKTSNDEPTMLRVDSKSIYNLNRNEMENNFRDQLASFDEENFDHLNPNLNRASIGLTHEFYTLTESLQKKDFKRMAAIYRFFFVKYNPEQNSADYQRLRKNMMQDPKSNKELIEMIEKKHAKFQEKKNMMDRMATVKACIYDPGVPGVGSQFGFLSQSLISLEYYLGMNGAYQWLIGKVFLDVLESLEFVFSEGFYLKKLGRSDIGLLAKKEISNMDELLLESKIF